MPLGGVLGGSWGRHVLRRSWGRPGGVLGGSREVQGEGPGVTGKGQGGRPGAQKQGHGGVEFCPRAGLCRRFWGACGGPLWDL